MWKKLPSDHLAVYQDQSWPASMDSPAVVATGIATRRIHDGQTITVDSGAGTVTLG